MSGYDDRTGFTHFTGTKIHRYWRPVPGLPDDPEERLAATGLPWYRDAHGGLHVRCDSGRLWTILSGLPSRDPPEPPVTDPQTEWLNVTNIGANLGPPSLAPSSVAKLLRRAGLLKRANGKDLPTDAATGLYHERLLGEDGWSSAFPQKSGEPPPPDKLQRLWAFEVIALLKALPPDKPSKPRKPPKMTEKQAELLKSLCEETGEPFDGSLSKSDATERIDELMDRCRGIRRGNPDLWFSKDEPMTDRQAEYLEDLCKKAGEPFDDTLTKSAAAKRIEELKAQLAPVIEARHAERERLGHVLAGIDSASGPSLSPSEVGRAMGKSTQSVWDYVSTNQLVGYSLDNGRTLRIPLWQFDLQEPVVRPWVPRLIEAFGCNGLSLMGFLTHPDLYPEGDRSYLQLLLIEGSIDEVIDAAKAFRELVRDRERRGAAPYGDELSYDYDDDLEP
jgi:hypothetical protein